MSLRSCSRSSCSSSARAKCIACDRITCVAHLEDHCCVTPKPSLDYENDSAGEQICESHSNQEVLVGCQVCLNVFCAICLSESFCSGLASSESGNSEPADASARSRVGHQYVDLVKFKTVCTEKINLHITYTKQRCVTTSRDLKLLKSRAESLLETGHSKLQEARRELEKRIQLIREVNEQEIEKFATHLKKVESQRDDQVNQMETQLATLEKILSQKEVVNENPATIRKFLSAFMEPPQTCVTSPSGDQAVAEDSLVIGEEETYHFIKVASSVQSTATRVLDSKQAKKSQRMSQPSCTVDAHPQQFGNTEPQHLGLGQKTPPISTPELDIHGRKIYSREFLLELRKKPLSQQKPEGLESTDLKHLLEKPDLARKLVLETNRRGAPGFPPDIFRSSTLSMRAAASKPFSEFEADKRKVHQMSTNGEFILKPPNGHSNPYHQQDQVMAQSFSANPPQSVNEGNPQTNNTRPPSSGLITLKTTYMPPRQQYSQPVSQYGQARTAAAPVAPQPTKPPRQPSKAIKIVDPYTLTEVDLKKAEAASQQQAARQTPKVRTSSITIADPKTQATVQPPPKQKTQQPEDDAKIKATKSEFAAIVAAAAAAAKAAVQQRAAISPKSTPSEPATAKPAEQATEASID